MKNTVPRPMSFARSVGLTHQIRISKGASREGHRFRRKAWPGITSQKFSHYRPGITGGKDVRQPIRRDRLNRQRQVRQSQSRFSVDFNTVAHFHSPGFIVPFRSKPACSAAFSHLLIVTADIDRIANVQTFYHDSDFSSEYQL
jgi:hypothetical protein